jgi:hypothetical protein
MFFLKKNSYIYKDKNYVYVLCVCVWERETETEIETYIERRDWELGRGKVWEESAERN